MRFASLALPIFLGLSLPPVHAEAPGPPVEIINLAPEFFDVMRSEPVERARRLENLLRKHPRIYGPVLPRGTNFEEYVGNTEKLMTGMQELEPLVLRQVAESTAQLNALLPPLRATSIYVGTSLFTSNGQVRMVDSRPVLVLGLDVQAYAENELLPPESRYDLRAFIIHELLHTHHYEQNASIAGYANRLFDRADPAPLYVGLWVEGLATCVSMGLDGDGSVERALMSKRLPSEIRPKLQVVAIELNEKLELRDIDAIADFFWLGRKRIDIPMRSGYAIGALVAGDVVRRVGLRQAMALKDEALLKAIRRSLQPLTQSNYVLDWNTPCASLQRTRH